MARNEEKQLGKLNRLWLQKEKEEGRLREIHQNRPKLSSLNSAIDVKKWIPSIKSEIEYYLQQSQLSHYSERKIKEFQNHIEELQKEYRCYLWKLRHLDPSHKEHPWKPRAYTRKRTPSINQQATLHSLKRPCMPQSNEAEVMTRKYDIEESDEVSEKSHLGPRTPDGIIYDCSAVNPDFQDQPLTFNSDRFPPRFSMHLTPKSTLGEPSHHMTEILLSRLPNLQATSSCGTTAELNREEEQIQTRKVRDNSLESISQTKTSGILGLSCYSSDEEL
ncbi:uncharacterized protein si:dkey-86e18.1 [Pristis pectinata]|uniref:uncharacterized protein si:dkey-86e18.1 n=1 Tax=Pristis pectinata TaxID=685728 RepID=UPI00223DD096|nr:uncharacterized protein si:dkey-86e18.1 [Pristis pectinata]